MKPLADWMAMPRIDTLLMLLETTALIVPNIFHGLCDLYASIEDSGTWSVAYGIKFISNAYVSVLGTDSA